MALVVLFIEYMATCHNKHFKWTYHVSLPFYVHRLWCHRGTDKIGVCW